MTITKSIRSKYSRISDTFILGCKLPNGIVYKEFNKENPDMKNII